MLLLCLTGALKRSSERFFSFLDFLLISPIFSGQINRAKLMALPLKREKGCFTDGLKANLYRFWVVPPKFC
jgi:hypothetical protein